MDGGAAGLDTDGGIGGGGQGGGGDGGSLNWRRPFLGSPVVSFASRSRKKWRMKVGGRHIFVTNYLLALHHKSTYPFQMSHHCVSQSPHPPRPWPGGHSPCQPHPPHHSTALRSQATDAGRHLQSPESINHKSTSIQTN